MGRLTLPVWSLIVSGVVQRGGGRGVLDTTEYRFNYFCTLHASWEIRKNTPSCPHSHEDRRNRHARRLA